LCEEAAADAPTDQIENKLNDFRLGEDFAATLGQRIRPIVEGIVRFSAFEWDVQLRCQSHNQ
jgi:hypothetical protein